MSEIITIPAGVILPAELLKWLRDRRDAARECAAEYSDQGDYDDAVEWSAHAAAFDEVIQHVQYG